MLVLFALLVLPLEWLLFKIFPPGRLKVALFRNRSGYDATLRDKGVMIAGVVIGYAVIGAVVWLALAWHHGFAA